ncbi:protein ABHD14B [Eurytemora carolleeae]|uniref:protein ABHD14B n=1 Tax=Eurytemora carolleeae TaxID=1294199 RepID=UPI000C785BB8|nr:protein ABHD14B [Eurytemora carolleeae]|eukprot:XP_023324492.1 protein ABHD14B-like [Eurytemora affinis]
MALNISSWRAVGLLTAAVLFILIGVRSDSVNWRTVDLQAVPLPSNLKDIMSKVDISQDTIDVDGAQIFYQSASPPDGVVRTGKTVLLLHGAAFTSQTWIDKVPTLATLAALGHGVVAVDLPGYGKSKEARVRNNGEFLAKLISGLAGFQPIIITPSMSGGFIIPMLSNKENRDLISGWVPVAPVGTSQASGFYSSIFTPTMIVYGEKDTGLGYRSRDDLSALPKSTLPQVLPGAGHPAYLDAPELWHTLLHNFINNIDIDFTE